MEAHWLSYVRGLRGNAVPTLLMNRRGDPPVMTDYEKKIQVHAPVKILDHEAGIPLRQLAGMYPPPQETTDPAARAPEKFNG